MRETGIIMSGDHPLKIMAGTKTQTRRTYGLEKINEIPDDWTLTASFEGGEARFFNSKTDEDITIKCPYGGVGDLLWVRETFRVEDGKVIYAADIGVDFTKKVGYYGDRYKPSIHMFRKDSRLSYPIATLRPERLWDISEEDAIAEGCFNDVVIVQTPIGKDYEGFYARDRYCWLWDSINGNKYPWSGNWWVWAIGWDHSKIKRGQ